MAKKQKHKQPSFNQSLVSDANIAAPKAAEEVGEIQTPRVEEKNSPENQFFRWVFLPDVIRHRKDEFGFGKYKDDASSFLYDIEVPLYDKYSDKTWRQVNATPHCGLYKKGSLSKKQKEKLHCSFDSYFRDNQTRAEVQEQLYHVKIADVHRLFGYKYNSIFYVVLNDENHNFDKL